MKRYLIASILSVLLPAAGSTAAQRIYEVGAVYIYYAWTPDDQIVHDLETIAATGINTINPYPSFLLAFGNPKPDFSKTDLILKTCERLKLRVMPTIFWSGLLPDYAAAKWPDRFSPTIDAESREANLALADREVLGLIDDYSRLTVEHFKNSPCIIAYNIWDEPHMEGFSLLAGAGRGGGDEAHFTRWFEEWGLKKYGSPAAWYAQWNDPLLNQEYARFDRPLFYWYASGQILEHLNELVKSIDPVHPTRTHNVGSTVVSDELSTYKQDDWTMSAIVDQYGLSYYPDIPARGAESNRARLEQEKALWDTPWTHSLDLTAAHDAAGGKRFVMPEVQTGPQTGLTRYGDEPGAIFDYNRIHLLAWQMAAHDAKGMYFWRWRPHMDEWQAFGRGLAASDGSITRRAVAAGDAARVLNSDPDLFLDSKPLAPQVAVVYDVVGDLKAKARGGDWGSFTVRNLIGIYHALWNDQVRVNVLDGRRVTADSLKPYKLVIFPFYLCLRQNVAEAIDAYVAGGGTVLADARFGIISELDRGYRVNPSLGMAKLFGARRHDLVAAYTPWQIRVTQPTCLLNGVTLPSRLTGRVFREALQLETGSQGKVAAVFETTGAPAVVVRRTGSGQSVLLGFSLGIPLLEDRDAGTAALLRAVWESAGVKPPVRVECTTGAGPVEAVVHSRGRVEERLVYLLNWGHSPASVTAELPWPGQSGLQGKDTITGRAIPIEHKEDRAVFNLALPPDHAAGVHIQARQK